MLVNMVIAGFGGQGILFSGKIVAYTGLLQGKEVSWLPSYGPEMRGGTANCSVCIDDEPIGCPMVLEPELFLAMNMPSYEKFIQDVPSGGTVIYDSSLIHPQSVREDLTVVSIPATSLATEHHLDHLANIILLGQTAKVTQFCSYELLCKALEQCVPASKQHLLDANLKALKIGYDYQA
jgi:2-oxoglutarate ferredoxin oxidoreductase subunit gamma